MNIYMLLGVAKESLFLRTDKGNQPARILEIFAPEISISKESCWNKRIFFELEINYRSGGKLKVGMHAVSLIPVQNKQLTSILLGDINIENIVDPQRLEINPKFLLNQRQVYII